MTLTFDNRILIINIFVNIIVNSYLQWLPGKRQEPLESLMTTGWMQGHSDPGLLPPNSYQLTVESSWTFVPNLRELTYFIAEPNWMSVPDLGKFVKASLRYHVHKNGTDRQAHGGTDIQTDK